MNTFQEYDNSEKKMDTLSAPNSLIVMDDLTAWSTFALAAFTLLLGLVGLVQLKSLVRSERLGTLSQYLTRYNEIVARIPIRYFDANFSISTLNVDEREKIVQVMFEYWNLIAEEFMFQRRGWIDNEIWSGWHRGISYHLEHHPFFRESYEILSQQFRYNRMLREFMQRRTV
jgi:hypothetical protein